MNLAVRICCLCHIASAVTSGKTVFHILTIESLFNRSMFRLGDIRSGSIIASLIAVR